MQGENIRHNLGANPVLGECDADILDHIAMVIETIGWNDELMMKTYGHETKQDYSGKLELSVVDWVLSLNEYENESLYGLVSGDLKM